MASPPSVFGSSATPSQPLDALAFTLSLLHQPLLIANLDPAVTSVSPSDPSDPSVLSHTETVGFWPLSYTYNVVSKYAITPDGLRVDTGPAPGVLSYSVRYKAEDVPGEEGKGVCRMSVDATAVPSYWGSWMGIGTQVVKKGMEAELLRRLNKKVRELSEGRVELVGVGLER